MKKKDRKGKGGLHKLIQYKKRQKTVQFSSITQTIEEYLLKDFPFSRSASEVAGFIGCKKSTAARILGRLAGRKTSPVQRFCPGYYIGGITTENFLNLDYPEVKLHNIKLQFVSLNADKADSPPALNTQKTKQIYWNYQQQSYKVTLQFNPTSTITVHLNASKKPLGQIAFRDYFYWLNGAFTGLGINFIAYEIKIVFFEMNCDYRFISVSPTMIQIRDLLDNSWLRIYRRYANLTRIECSITYEGHKEIYRLFKELTKQSHDIPRKDDFIDVV